MRVEVEEEIIKLLKENSRLNLGDLKARATYPGQDVRKALKYLMHNDERVYVEGVENKNKYYAYRENHE